MLLFDPGFWNQPIDLLLFQLLIWFGWIPLVLNSVWGFVLVWKNHRQGQFNGTLTHVLLAIDVPSATEQTPKAVENLFNTLAAAYSGFTWKEEWIIGKFQPSFSFELVSTEGYIQFLVRTQAKYRDAVEAGVYAHYPDAEIAEVEDYTSGFPDAFPNDTHEMWGAELTLKQEQFFPIRTHKDFEDPVVKELKDPLGQVLEQLGKMRPGEHYWVQIVCQTSNSDWKEAGIKFINKIYGIEKPHTEGNLLSTARSLLAIPDEVLAKTIGIGGLSGLFLPPSPKMMEQDQWKAFKLTPSDIEQTKAVLAKIGKPGFLTKIRVVYVAKKEAFNKGARVLLIKGMFNQYAHLNLNSIGFSPLTVPKDDYFWQKWSYAKRQKNLMKGYKTRSMGIGATPRILNSEELATLWHFPSLLLKAPLVRKSEARRAEPPTGLPMGLEGEDVIAQGLSKMRIRETETQVETALPVALPHPTLEPSSVAEEEEEREMGLDAVGMGPPADVELPHPMLGSSSDADTEDQDGDGAREGAPPENLPT